MKITVAGCGRWGTFIAWYLDKLNYSVTLYGRETSLRMKGLIANRKNDKLTLSDSLNLSTDMDNSIQNANLLVISISVQDLRNFLTQIKYNLKNKDIPILLCMKGIEMETGYTPTQIVKDILGEHQKCAVWIGPGHVEDFVRGIPNCMVIDSENKEFTKFLVESFSSDLIRFYYGTNLLGNEIGAASKNVIGIAAGILDGMNLSSLKGALMARGTNEIAKLMGKMGADKSCAYGLCHLGDYEATVFSKFSNNRKFGESFVKKEKYEKLAEGFYTAKALMNLSEKYSVELPITKAVYEIIYENKDVNCVLESLLKRSLKFEF